VNWGEFPHCGYFVLGVRTFVVYREGPESGEHKKNITNDGTVMNRKWRSNRLENTICWIATKYRLNILAYLDSTACIVFLKETETFSKPGKHGATTRTVVTTRGAVQQWQRSVVNSTMMALWFTSMLTVALSWLIVVVTCIVHQRLFSAQHRLSCLQRQHRSAQSALAFF
jgi:hypothetical protein